MRRLRFVFPALFLALGLCSFIFSAVQAKTTPAKDGKSPTYVLEMKGAIGPAFNEYLKKGLQKASTANAQLVVIELNTPGGLLTSTREMVTQIIEAPMPVAVYVTPSGAHAASAGTFIMYAAHIAAMNKGTNVGAATPIEMRGQVGNQLGKELENPRDSQKQSEDETMKSLQDMLKDLTDPNAKAMRNKAMEDTTAFIRGLAEMRGRNAEWAVKAVKEASSLTAEEALKQNVIEYVADSRSELLSKIDGKSYTLKSGKKVTLALKDAPVVEFKPDWRTKLIAMITDPNIAFILMSLGVYGLILEFYNPGTMIPGSIGLICLLVGLYAMNVLPVNATGVALVLAGIGFMVAEAFMPSFGIMGVAGVIAFMLGATMMFDSGEMMGMALDTSLIWGFGILGLGLVALIVWLTYRAIRSEVTTGTESMIGRNAKVVEWKGREGRIHIQGEDWQAVSDHDYDLKPGDSALVSKIEGLIIKIRPAA